MRLFGFADEIANDGAAGRMSCTRPHDSPAQSGAVLNVTLEVASELAPEGRQPLPIYVRVSNCGRWGWLNSVDGQPQHFRMLQAAVFLGPQLTKAAVMASHPGTSAETRVHGGPELPRRTLRAKWPRAAR